MNDNREKLMEKLQEDVHWGYSKNYLNSDDKSEILKDFEEWLKTAHIRKTYYWSIYSYTLEEYTEDDAHYR